MRINEEDEMLLSGQGTIQIEDIFSNQIIEEISCDSQASLVHPIKKETHKPRNIIHMSNFSQTVHSRKPEERSPSKRAEGAPQRSKAILKKLNTQPVEELP